MAKNVKQHRKVGEDYLRKAKTPGAVHRFPFPPEVVWAALLDGPAWAEWLDGITGVDWTSPKPFGIGTTRTVHLKGGQRVEEFFFAWDEGRRMAFYFDRSTLPIKAAVEDYRVRPAPGGSELIWSGRASGFPLGPIVSSALGSGIRKGLPELEALIARNPARFGG